MEIVAKIIKGIRYSALMCRNLNTYKLKDLNVALSKDATFFLEINNQNKFAVSWWVSAKRTRSYPYARVYDSYGFTGKKVTVIPIFKDEGIEGDRDFLQWDTISLMSLLNIYVIVSYYKTASKSSRYASKITNQRFDVDQVNTKIKQLLDYQDDALHWNLLQVADVQTTGKNAINSYDSISKELNVELHSREGAKKKITELMKDKDTFLKTSRNLAKMAQRRESLLTHKAELVDGTKASLTISNYLGGNYYFTSDEVRVKNNKLFLVEAKNTKKGILPHVEDIKDGLLRMILFTNLEEVKVQKDSYINIIPVLKLTSVNESVLGKRETAILELLKKEADLNNFKVEVNGKFIS